jgi:actin-binding LIM protein
MCTVLQQHLLNQTNGFAADSSSMVTSTPAATSSSLHRLHRHISPIRLAPQATYSYLQDMPHLRKPVDPYDRINAGTPTKQHFHLPPPERRGRRGKSPYIEALLSRRSRSHSRTGMRVLVEYMKASTPRARSPHMNNEEPIEMAHYPDGRRPEESDDRAAPIERDDFPAPPFSVPDRRRRHHSEPSQSIASTMSDQVEESSSSEGETDEVETVDEKMDRTEAELRKISSGGMGKVFLQELSIEREKRKAARHRVVDPRSAARTPTAKREPHFRLRYESPLNASPSRIADHPLPWDEWDGTASAASGRRSNLAATPFFPSATPHPPPGRVVSPINPIRPGYTQKPQVPARFSPGSGLTGYDSSGEGAPLSTSKSDMSDKSDVRKTNGTTPRVSSAPASGVRSSSQPTPSSAKAHRTPDAEFYDTDYEGLRRDSWPRVPSPLQAPNIYPLHLLFTTNYRLPGDVDRCNLEAHLSDAEFDTVFRMGREDFYRLPYWKRCDMKRKYCLF